MRVEFDAPPAQMVVQPASQFYVRLSIERTALAVRIEQFALRRFKDFEFTLMHIAMAARTEADQIFGDGLATLGKLVQMMEVKPDPVRASRSSATPAIPPKDFHPLSSACLARCRIEAELVVLPAVLP